MKKYIIISIMFVLSGCACFNSSDAEDQETIVYTSPQAKNMNCDYFDGKTCYRYVRRTQKVVAPRPVMRYREAAPRPCPRAQHAMHHTPCAMQAPCMSAAPIKTSPCQSQVSETREPIEIVYKKTTTQTTYEPQTTTSVSYEKVPYLKSKHGEIIEPRPNMRANVNPERNEYIDYETNEELIMDVK